MKKKKTALTALFLTLCMLLSVFSAVPVLAGTSSKSSNAPAGYDETMIVRPTCALNNAAVRQARQAIKFFYGRETASRITVVGPMDILKLYACPQSKEEAYLATDLEALCPKKDRDSFKLFFIYDGDKPLTYITLMKCGNAWKLYKGYYKEALPRLLEDKALLERMHPNADIGYLLMEDEISVYTKGLKDGHIILRESGKSTPVKLRDFTTALYQMQKQADAAGMTVQHWSAVQVKYHKDKLALGCDGFAEKINSRISAVTVIPVWQFWLPRIGIPVAVVLILAGTVVVMVRRRKKKAE